MPGCSNPKNRSTIGTKLENIDEQEYDEEMDEDNDAYRSPKFSC